MANETNPPAGSNPLTPPETATKDVTPPAKVVPPAPKDATTVQPPSGELQVPPRGPGRPRKDASPAPEPVQPPPAQVVVMQVQPVAPPATEGLDSTVDGGVYFDHRGRRVDSFGHPIPQGAEAQDPDVMARHRAGASSLGSTV